MAPANQFLCTWQKSSRLLDGNCMIVDSHDSWTSDVKDATRSAPGIARFKWQDARHDFPDNKNARVQKSHEIRRWIVLLLTLSFIPRISQFQSFLYETLRPGVVQSLLRFYSGQASLILFIPTFYQSFHNFFKMVRIAITALLACKFQPTLALQSHN